MTNKSFTVTWFELVGVDINVSQNYVIQYLHENHTANNLLMYHNILCKGEVSPHHGTLFESVEVHIFIEFFMTLFVY